MHTLPFKPGSERYTERHWVQLLTSLTGSLLAIFLVVGVNVDPSPRSETNEEPGRVAGIMTNLGDINNDLTVDIYDLGIVAAHYDTVINATTDESIKAADLNIDGTINVFDIGILIGLYGTMYAGPPTMTPSPTPSPTTTPVPTNTTVPTRTPTTTVSATVPAQVLNLTQWKITLPSSGSASEIKQPALATFKNDSWFTVSSDRSVRFRAPVVGGTTSGSSYPRSELREMTNNGTANASWSSTTGNHIMTIDQAITAVPRFKKHIVAGQIHDGNDDVIVIRLEYPKLFIDINGNDGPVLDPNYTLGKRFTVKFEVQNNQTNIYYNGNNTPAHTLNQEYSGAYFKAGAYTQSNCSTEKQRGGTDADCDENNYGEVLLYDLKIAHQ